MTSIIALLFGVFMGVLLGAVLIVALADYWHDKHNNQ